MLRLMLQLPIKLTVFNRHFHSLYPRLDRKNYQFHLPPTLPRGPVKGGGTVSVLQTARQTNDST